MMKTYNFKNVYVSSFATACGPTEAEGPLAGKFDSTFDDVYCDEKSYEAAERRLVKEATDMAIQKGKIKEEEIEVIFGGDLINQLATSNYFAKDLASSFVGVYGACSNSALTSIMASIFIEGGFAKNALAFTSSHNCTAERQFRYPNEYAVQKPPSTTFTATGAGAIIYSNDKYAKIQITSATIGKVIDFDYKNPNDMGSAMAPAAFDTIQAHFKNTNTSFDDYDLIATGDLSTIGNEILIDLFKHENMDHHGKLVDCGCILFDREKQEVFAGGSGCACSALVMISYFFDKLMSHDFHKVMIVPTGALLSPVVLNQKESIPCIAHAIVFERVVD